MPFTYRIRIVSSALLATLALALALAGTAQATSFTAKETSFVRSVNAVRKAHGLKPLHVDPALTRAARAYSAELLRQNVFTHGAFASRIAGSGARGPTFGENLAWGVGGAATAGSIVRAWMASPGHRANLLRPGYQRVGIGALVGTFAGYRGATVVTADFAGT
jgi:uncharacterized protein YkwD